MTEDTISAVVLAGGRATRMGGQDKGLIKIAGRNIVTRITRQLSTQVEEIVINANRNLEQYAELGYPVVSDKMDDYQGPLAGMAAAFSIIRHQWLLTAPCDGPYIAADYCVRMLAQAKKDCSKIAVATDGNRLQPVYALIHRDLIGSLNDFLQSDERKIDRWYQQHSFTQVAFADDEMFTNINTPQQLEEVEKKLSR